MTRLPAITLAFTVALAIPMLWAQQPTPVPVPAPTPVQPGWDPRGAAELQVLDKVAARATVLVVKLGQTVRHGAITITARACFVRPPNQEPDAVAFLEITDPRRPESSFRGWMFADNPAQAMLQHPIYDVRVLTCR